MSDVHDANSRSPLRKEPEGLFVTGSNTNVGKTFASQILIRKLLTSGHLVGAYKPAASGLVPGEPSDVELLWRATGCRRSLKEICPQQFAAPLAPCLAAELEGRQVDESLLIEGARAWFEHSDIVVVEGAGGLLSPISWTMTNADLAQQFGLPLVVVVANQLGAVNQALLTLAHAEHLQLAVQQLILSDVEPTSDEVFEQHRRMLLQAAPGVLNRALPRMVHLRHGAADFAD